MRFVVIASWSFNKQIKQTKSFQLPIYYKTFINATGIQEGSLLAYSSQDMLHK